MMNECSKEKNPSKEKRMNASIGTTVPHDAKDKLIPEEPAHPGDSLPFPLPLTSAEEKESFLSVLRMLANGLSHIRIVESSEQEANMRSFFGFQTTAFTLPSPWPLRTSSKTPVSRCQT